MASAMYHQLRYRFLRYANPKLAVSTLLYKLGYQISRIDPIDRSAGQREDPEHDERELLRFAGVERPVVFDVGSNIGQTVKLYRAAFPTATIHSFEPLPKAFELLRSAAAIEGNTIVNNVALYSSTGAKRFFSNRGGANETSSFYEPGELAKHCYDPSGLELEEVIEVQTLKLDEYCARAEVDHIDLLKLDTQGSEIEIMRGAQDMLARKAIKMVYSEVLFTEYYKDSPLYHHVASVMEEHGLVLFRIYYMDSGAGGRNACANALFVERSLLVSYLDQFTRA